MAKGQSRKGLPRGRGAIMAEATFAKLWRDPTVNIETIAARLGISRQAVRIRARVRGLPPRVGSGNTARARTEQSAPEIAPMWLANVGLAEMARHFGCSHTAILRAANRLGLPKRELTRWDAITIEDYRAAQLRTALAASARETEAALRLAEMKDGDPRRWAA